MKNVPNHQPEIAIPMGENHDNRNGRCPLFKPKVIPRPHGIAPN